MAYLAKFRETLESGSTADKGKRANAVQEIFSVYNNAQRGHRLMWLACAAFARGIQYAILDEDDRLVTPTLPEGIKMSKMNVIGSWKKHQMARVTRVRPEFEVEPGKMLVDNIRAAQAGTAFLQHNMEINNWEKKRYTITGNCIDFGNCYAYLRDYEDPLRLTPVPVLDDDGEPMTDPADGKPVVTYTKVRDVRWEVLMPHYVFHDLKPGHIDNKYEVILAFRRDLSYFPLTYNIEVEPDQKGYNTMNYDIETLTKTRETPSSIQSATELIYMRKPNEKDKKGKVIITTATGNKILKEYDWPFKYLEGYPLVLFQWGEPESGEFYSRSPIEDQIPLQKDINEGFSIIQENISNVGHIKWGVPIGSGINSLDDISGEFVQYQPGRKPEQLAVAPLPNHIVCHPSLVMKVMEDIQLHHSVSKGAGTPNVRSAVGLDRLEEEDQEPLNIIDDFFGLAYAEVGTKAIKIGAEKLDVPQLIKYIGEGRRKTIENFKGEMLDPLSKVKVRMIDAHLRHKGTAQRTIIELSQAGLIGTDKFGNIDPTRIQKMLQFAIPEVLYDKEDRQRDIAYDENESIMRGESVEAKQWEYQLIHIEVIEDLLNSVEFKLRAGEDENFQQLAISHWQEHKNIVLKALGGQSEEGNLPPKAPPNR